MSDYAEETMKALADRYDKSTVVGEVTTTLPITADMVDAVLVGAFDGSYGACYYWADLLDIKVQKAEDGEGDIDSRFRLRFDLWQEVTIRENEDVADPDDNPIYTVNAENITRAFQEFAKSETPANTSITGYIQQALRENDPSFMDADCSDVIVQVAVFGKVVYG